MGGANKCCDWGKSGGMIGGVIEEVADRNGGWVGGLETLVTISMLVVEVILMGWLTLILIADLSVSTVEVILCLAVTTPTGIF